ncbi:MAG: hypothetical protein H6746_08050 [Deltaproteobacteria bacterium]|nr:hypothetical protein [Deltaproteobacteria bacterium]
MARGRWRKDPGERLSELLSEEILFGELVKGGVVRAGRRRGRKLSFAFEPCLLGADDGGQPPRLALVWQGLC